VKVPPSHISLPSNDLINAGSVPTPSSEYQTPSSNPRSLDVSPDVVGDGDVLRKERPESQPSIDPLSLHIIRRVSQRPSPKDGTEVSDIQVVKHSDEAEKENHPQSTSDSKASQQSVKSL
jgi:hypothetical protein